MQYPFFLLISAYQHTKIVAITYLLTYSIILNDTKFLQSLQGSCANDLSLWQFSYHSTSRMTFSSLSASHKLLLSVHYFPKRM